MLAQRVLSTVISCVLVHILPAYAVRWPILSAFAKAIRSRIHPDSRIEPSDTSTYPNSAPAPYITGGDSATTSPSTSEVTTDFTTEVTTAYTTITSPQFTSTRPTVTLETTNLNDRTAHSSSPTPVNVTLIETVSPQTSSQLIGIVIGTAAAAILLTILIVCVIWKLRTRPERYRRNERPEMAITHTSKSETHHVRDVRQKPLKTVTHVSPTVHDASDRNSHIAQSPRHYTYIDITQATTSSPTTAFNSSPAVSSTVEYNHTYSTVVEIVTEKHNRQYSLCRERKDRLENASNSVNQHHATANKRLFIYASTASSQILGPNLETTYSEIRPANVHIPLRIGQGASVTEGDGSYSTLGDSKATRVM